MVEISLEARGVLEQLWHDRGEEVMDPEALDRWRQVSPGHEMAPCNRTSLRRLVQTIDALAERTKALSRPSPVGVGELPWGDLKVAFDLEDPEALWDADRDGLLALPPGWSLNETDGSGARYVSVFRVEGVMPSIADGLAVIQELVRIRALPAKALATLQTSREG